MTNPTDFTSQESLQLKLDAFYDCVGGGTRNELGLELRCLGFSEDTAALMLARVSMDLAYQDITHDADSLIELGSSVLMSYDEIVDVMIG